MMLITTYAGCRFEALGRLVQQFVHFFVFLLLCQPKQTNNKTTQTSHKPLPTHHYQDYSASLVWHAAARVWQRRVGAALKQRFAARQTILVCRLSRSRHVRVENDYKK